MVARRPPQLLVLTATPTHGLARERLARQRRPSPSRDPHERFRARPQALMSLLGMLIFSSRWLQLPMYLGLIAAQGVYVVQCLRELWHLLGATLGFAPADAAHGAIAGHDAATTIMLAVLGLIDVVPGACAVRPEPVEGRYHNARQERLEALKGPNQGRARRKAAHAGRKLPTIAVTRSTGANGLSR